MAGKKPTAKNPAKRAPTLARGRSRKATARKPRSRKTDAPQAPVTPPAPIRGGILSQAKSQDLPAPEFPEIADPKKRAYVVQLALTGKFDDAAKAAGVTLRTGWNWRHNDEEPDFLRAVKVAEGLAGDRLEAEIVRRALDGWEEPVYQGGRMVGTVRKFSDTLLIFQTKKARPEYRDRHEITGKDGGPIQVQSVDLTKLSEEQLIAVEAAAAIAQGRVSP